ncbi:hypothetical protein Tco_1506076 [Tanacetum coccineum]
MSCSPSSISHLATPPDFLGFVSACLIGELVRITTEDLDRDGECGFDYLTLALVSSKAHREGVGIHMADSHTCNHPEGGFTPLKTIRRLLVVIGRRSYSGFKGEAFEPKDEDGTYARKDFHAYTGMEPQLFKETILKNFDFIENYMLKTIIHAQMIQKWLDDKKLQIQECKVQEVKAPDAISEDKAQEHCMIYLDDEYVVMTRNYFLQYTQLQIPEFHDTLIQHMESVKKSIDERAHHKRWYDSRVDDRQMQTIEEKVVSEIRENRSQHANDEDIRPIYDEEPMDEVQMTAEINFFATGQQHIEQPKFNNEGEVDQNAEQCHDTCPLPAKLTDNQTTELSNQSLESENIFVRQPTAFKSERPRISKPRFASKVDVNNDLSKPVTTHYLPKEKESAVAKPHHMIAPGSPRYSSNDMVHNHYLEEAKKKTQERNRNSRPSVMPSARLQSTTNDCKLKPRINNQNSRNWPVSKSTCI